MRFPEENLDIAQASSANPLLERWLAVMRPFWEFEQARRAKWEATRTYVGPTEEELNKIIEPYTARRELVKQYAWAVPTDEALDAIVRHSPQGVVEIGAGTGYWASLLRQRGCFVMAYDTEPYTSEQSAAHWSTVEIGGPEKAALWPQLSLFLCWPPYDTSMAFDCLQAYAGSTLAYVGEGDGGCTGDDKFHRQLERKWELIEAVALPQWEGIHDWLHIYRRGPGTTAGRKESKKR